MLCASGDSCNVNVDTLSVSPTGAAVPTMPDMRYLGGYTRGFDTATYGPKYGCPAGTPLDHIGADPSAPLILRVYPGGHNTFTLYQDAGSGTGYEKGQYILTRIRTSSHGEVSTVGIGPSRGGYPGQADTGASRSS